MTQPTAACPTVSENNFQMVEQRDGMRVLQKRSGP